MIEKCCPVCQGLCWRDSVDVGVGTIYGPYGCPDCGWSEDARYNKRSPDHKAIQDGCYVDQFGRGTPVARIKERAEDFGIGKLVSEAFES